MGNRQSRKNKIERKRREISRIESRKRSLNRVTEGSSKRKRGGVLGTRSWRVKTSRRLRKRCR